jgi:hypothetical protein
MTLISYVGVDAQSDVDQVYKPFVMELDNGNEKKTFVLNSFSYYISNYADSTEVRYQQVSVTFSMPVTKDDWIVQWIADPEREMSGKFIIRDPKTGESMNEYSFKKTLLESASESYYGYDYYSNENKNIQITLLCSEFFLGNIPVKNIKNNRY